MDQMETTEKSKPKSKGSKITLILFLLAGIILFATNPSEADFKVYLKEEAKAEAKAEGGLTGAFMELFAGPASRLAGISMVRTDYYVFSVYELSDIGNNHTYLGILNHFSQLK